MIPDFIVGYYTQKTLLEELQRNQKIISGLLKAVKFSNGMATSHVPTKKMRAFEDAEMLFKAGGDNTKIGKKLCWTSLF